MKIAPVLISPIKQNNVVYKDKTPNVNHSGRIFVNSNLYYTSFIGNQEYKYKLISSKKPDFKSLEGKYNNVKEFSALYSQKLNSQLSTIEKEDIESLINRLKIKTKASDETIKEVLYNLTLFSNYNALDFLGEIAEEFSTNLFGLDRLNGYKISDISMNKALDYLTELKQTVKKGSNQKSIVILDDTVLKEIEEAKRTLNPAYLLFLNNVKRNNIIFLNLPGWDVKCLDDKYRSANFLLGSGYLENIALDSIKRLNRGEKSEDILYGDFEKRLKDITGIENIEVIRKSPKKKSFISRDDIFNNLKKPSVSQDKIRKIILNESKRVPKSQRKDFIKALCEYLDEYSFVYSTDSMAKDLVSLKSKIDSKYKDQQDSVLYCIASDDNSAGFITSIYAKLNNIDIRDIKPTSNCNWGHIDNLKDKNIVLLDDNSITGSSIVGFELALEYSKSQAKTNWYTLLATSRAVKKLKNKNHEVTPKSFNYLRKLKSPLDDKNTKAGSIELINKDRSLGFENSGVICAFPHMIPDNCIDLSSVLFEDILIKSNDKTNKPLDDYIERRKNQVYCF